MITPSLLTMAKEIDLIKETLVVYIKKVHGSRSRFFLIENFTVL